ncbi:molybdopterin molybdotransferase MoeA [[Clostridium] polysaccharolyticum]|uniref:Molybdopterin molybdenumtransferase n=1 Tax=[Clostridium] polysaccharolyticum TaxID=29364 RepID=A0A1I0EDU2_9FIRM|nr:gephyrin-like molybdotransferase Glp [[Clostridium] polysaccharolyticum]SET43214.1 molybdopterin molybdotransferase [[Clostridium] polysaccharolyticum]
MLNVKTVRETKEIVKGFCKESRIIEEVKVQDAAGRILAEDLYNEKNVPEFTRSTVDGFCVKASDVFGCSDSMPAILEFLGNIKMGEKPPYQVKALQCAYIATGGYMPEGTDSVVMMEYTENYGDEIGILKPAAPGENVIFEGDDGKAGELLLQKGTRLTSRSCGVLLASGVSKVKVKKQIKAAVISSGNELVSEGAELLEGQIYDVNGPMLTAALKECGCEAEFLGIIQDEAEVFEQVLQKAAEEYDMVLLSGGTSVGIKDLTANTLNKLGNILVHGIAVKPGKPTIIAKVKDKLVFGLPGNPVAAYFVFYLFVRTAIQSMYGYQELQRMEKKIIGSSISSNHGREEYIPVRIEEGKAYPVMGKSGLISMLKEAEGYIYIERDREGITKGMDVNVVYF